MRFQYRIKMPACVCQSVSVAKFLIRRNHSSVSSASAQEVRQGSHKFFAPFSFFYCINSTFVLLYGMRRPGSESGCGIAVAVFSFGFGCGFRKLRNLKPERFVRGLDKELGYILGVVIPWWIRLNNNKKSTKLSFNLNTICL